MSRIAMTISMWVAYRKVFNFWVNSKCMPEEFHQVEEDYLRVIGGVPSNMKYIMRIGSSTLTGNTHLLYGPLQQVGTQLFVDLAPMIAPGSYVQIRQKMNQDDVIAVEVVATSNGQNQHIKDPSWHYQPQNKTPFYFTNFSIGSVPIQLAIGSVVSEKQLLEYFANQTL